jgi:hypothetical protein
MNMCCGQYARTFVYYNLFTLCKVLVVFSGYLPARFFFVFLPVTRNEPSPAARITSTVTTTGSTNGGDEFFFLC